MSWKGRSQGPMVVVERGNVKAYMNPRTGMMALFVDGRTLERKVVGAGVTVAEFIAYVQERTGGVCG